jgi:hypothetical protein
MCMNMLPIEVAMSSRSGEESHREVSLLFWVLL